MDAAARLDELASEAAGCRDCPLWRDATQTVFGAGSPSARLVLIGEQPGDVEDREGEPFVGPAGRLLDEALDAAEIRRNDTYVTNAVKHFKWEPRGKRRIHQPPNAREIEACHPWLEHELAVVKPRVLVSLGATASQALLGRSFRVSRERGRLIRGTRLAPVVMATVHPSSVLRARDDDERREARAAFVADLAQVAPLLLETEDESAQPSSRAQR
jgi:DNA polymerase